jgi:hypothetical protein
VRRSIATPRQWAVTGKGASVKYPPGRIFLFLARRFKPGCWVLSSAVFAGLLNQFREELSNLVFPFIASRFKPVFEIVSSAVFAGLLNQFREEFSNLLLSFIVGRSK